MPRVIFAIALALGCRGGEPAPAASPRDKLIEAIRAGAPTAKVEAEDELAVRVRRAKRLEPNDEGIVINTYNLQQVCAQSPEACDEKVGMMARQVVAMLASDGKPAPINPAALRAIVRDRAFFADNELQRSEEERFVRRPFVGPLFAAYAEDRAETMRAILAKDLTELEMTADQLHDKAVANLRAAVGTLELEPIEGLPGAFKLVGGDSYDAARLLVHDLWAPLAAKADGELVAIAISRDNVLVTSTNHPDMIETAQRVWKQNDEPYALELQPLVWRKTGWEPFAPPPPK